MSVGELCGQVATTRPRGECILPDGHDGPHQPVCGALSGPTSEPPWFCGLPDGHAGVCQKVGFTVDSESGAVEAVLPFRTGDAPSDPSDGVSGAEGASAAPSGVDPAEQIEQTAPVFAAELVLTSIGFWVQRLPGGGRQVKVVAVEQTPAGPQPRLPGYVLEFSADGWAKFQEAIGRDGEPRPNIPIATHLPEGFLG